MDDNPNKKDEAGKPPKRHRRQNSSIHKITDLMKNADNQHDKNFAINV